MAKTAKAKTKATTTKKVTKKPASVAKKVTKKKEPAAVQPQFFQVKITDQSLYWLIFGAVCILFAVWVYTLDARVRDLYDQIDANTYSTDTMLEVHAAKQKAMQTTE